MTEEQTQKPAPQPGLEDVKAWEGYRVDDVTGQGVARVEGLFVDGESDQPTWLLVKLGRFGKVVPSQSVNARPRPAASGHLMIAR